MRNNSGLWIRPLSVDGLVGGFPVACVVGVVSPLWCWWCCGCMVGLCGGCRVVVVVGGLRACIALYDFPMCWHFVWAFVYCDACSCLSCMHALVGLTCLGLKLGELNLRCL